jgi:hypothetical protein
MPTAAVQAHFRRPSIDNKKKGVRISFPEAGGNWRTRGHLASLALPLDVSGISSSLAELSGCSQAQQAHHPKARPLLCCAPRRQAYLTATVSGGRAEWEFLWHWRSRAAVSVVKVSARILGPRAAHTHTLG